MTITTGLSVQSGVLSCPDCAIHIPVVQGFPMFTEAQLGSATDAHAALPALDAKLAPSADYMSFLHRRHVRRIPDRYAAFQPFNESTRAFYALLDLVRMQLRPGDLILDSWGRTGWSGEMLAALFPEQHVVSIWEGNFDVLGYMGYAHWLAAGRRAPNHDIVFVPPGGPLPFGDGKFALVHGLDSLHRYAPATFIGDLLRIARDDAPIIFPHVHMANSEPSPYFDRGGLIVHGRRHLQRLQAASKRQARSAIVMAEVTLFDAGVHGATTLLNEPDTPHYNGLVALVPPAWENAPLRRADLDFAVPGAHGIVNALLDLDGLNGRAVVDPNALGGLMADLLLRHPCYAGRLERLETQTLAPQQLQILFQLGQMRTMDETAKRLQLPLGHVCDLARAMVNTELLQLAPVSGAMARLQTYYASQIVRPLPQEETFDYLWQLLPALYRDRPLLLCGIDDSAFGVDEVTLLVPTLQQGLRALGVGPGDRVVMLCAQHPEAVLLTWAIWRVGAVVVPLRKELAETPTQLTPLLNRIEPALLVLDRPRHGAAALAACPAVLLDALQDDEAPLPANNTLPELSDLLKGWLELPSESTAHVVQPDDPAVILFTSGSTGTPKGVVHSQRALLHSGQLAATEFGWHDQDLLLSLGDFHTMSGLRNPLVAALFAGAGVYLADETERHGVGKTLQAAQRHGVTVLSTGPAWLAMLDLLPSHLTLHPARLRQILCTGAPLQSTLHAALAQRMQLAIVDYYGLTETGGLCMVFDHAPGADDAAPQAGGRPVGAVVQICDASGAPLPAGQPGELRVHSNQLMLGYWRDAGQTAQVARDNWLYTGDIANHDGHGRITLLGRYDDRLKNEYGDIVHPALLERAVCALPQVREAAITSGPQGLVGMLVVDVGFDMAAFVAACRHQPTADVMPRQWQVQDALPYTAAGKLDRKSLAQSLIKV
nr:class I adenylate-forming enzyme family protein [Duganella phyllosphaerae]